MSTTKHCALKNLLHSPISLSMLWCYGQCGCKPKLPVKSQSIILLSVGASQRRAGRSRRIIEPGIWYAINEHGRRVKTASHIVPATSRLLARSTIGVCALVCSDSVRDATAINGSTIATFCALLLSANRFMIMGLASQHLITTALAVHELHADGRNVYPGVTSAVRIHCLSMSSARQIRAML